MNSNKMLWLALVVLYIINGKRETETNNGLSVHFIIKVPLALLVDIGSLLYAPVNVFHPDWLIRSIFRLRRSESNLHKDSHQTTSKNKQKKLALMYSDN